MKLHNLILSPLCLTYYVLFVLPFSTNIKDKTDEEIKHFLTKKHFS